MGRQVDESAMDTLPPVGDLPGPGVDTSVDLEPRPGMVLAERYVLEEPLGRGAWGWGRGPEVFEDLA